MSNSVTERQARHKVRMATQLLIDAMSGYAHNGHVYDRPALNAEVLQPIVEELSARIAEDERLAPLLN